MIEKDKEELSQSIPRWIKLMEVLEKGSYANRNEVSKLLTELSNGLKKKLRFENLENGFSLKRRSCYVIF